MAQKLKAQNLLKSNRLHLDGGMTHLQCATLGAMLGVALFIYSVGPW